MLHYNWTHETEHLKVRWRVGTAHQPLKAPEARQVYSNPESHYIKAPAGRQVDNRQRQNMKVPPLRCREPLPRVHCY